MDLVIMLSPFNRQLSRAFQEKGLGVYARQVSKILREEHNVKLCGK